MRKSSSLPESAESTKKFKFLEKGKESRRYSWEICKLNCGDRKLGLCDLMSFHLSATLKKCDRAEDFTLVRIKYYYDETGKCFEVLKIRSISLISNLSQNKSLDRQKLSDLFNGTLTPFWNHVCTPYFRNFLRFITSWTCLLLWNKLSYFDQSRIKYFYIIWK